MSECDIQKLISDHTALQNENTILKEQLALMQEQLEWFRKQFFVRKTEQTSVIMNEGTQLSMFPEENVQAVSSFLKLSMFLHISVRKSALMMTG